MTTPDPKSTIFLPPTDTVAVWRERGELRPTVAWSEMINEEHAVSFTVAKVAKLDLLAAIRASLDTVISKGGTFEEWKRNLLPELQRAGWWGVVTDRELTGTDEPVIVNDRRLRTIYNTNVRMSIAGGRWRKFQREKERFPYLRYMSNHFRRHPRLDHLSWHNLILPIDDPAWEWLFPPNGWGCNCKVEQVSDLSLELNNETVGVAPEPHMVGFTTATGRVIQVPQQVAPGFGYNPGSAHLQALNEKLVQTVDTALANGLDAPARDALRAFVEDRAFASVITAPQLRVPVALLQDAAATTWSLPSRLLLVEPAASAALPADLALAIVRSLFNIEQRAIIVARDGADLLVWHELPGGAVVRARIVIDHGRGRIVDLTPTTAEDAAAQSAGLDIILDRLG